MPAEEKLKQARAARLAGDYRLAELVTREIIDRDPINADAIAFLAQLLAEQGDRSSTLEQIDFAIKLAPRSAATRVSAAAVRERAGDMPGALNEARLASELDPKRFDAWATLGTLLGKAGVFDKSERALANAFKIDDSHPGVGLLLAGARMEVGDYDGAVVALNRVEEIAPGLPQTARLRVNAAHARSDFDELARAAETWLRIEPDNDEPRRALGFAYAELNRMSQAADAFRPLAERDDADPKDIAAYGRYVLGARRFEEAGAVFDRALALDPDAADALFGKARLLTYQGALDDAAQACRRTLAAEPGHAEALAQLVELTSGRLDDAEYAALEKAAGNSFARPDQQIAAMFALGAARHARGRPAEAFAAWSQANAMARRARGAKSGYDAAREVEAREAIEALFPGALKLPAAGPDRSASDPIPIFVVGMPRSGTTLLENALSAHEDVEGAGEQPVLPHVLSGLLDYSSRPDAGKLRPFLIGSWRKTFFERIVQSGVHGARYVVDKQPLNFRSVGLIRLLFPEARIIHVRRNPVEVGFSIFRRNFSRQWSFTTDLAAIGHYYGQHARLMRHWDANFPGATAFVQYEDLVADFEKELRRIVEYCGLEWRDAMLNFHERERRVTTFSAVQVRKPVTASHLDAAEPYRDKLKPLVDALVEAGVDLETGAFASH